MMLSQTTEYALRSMVVLAMTPDQLVSTVTVAKRAQIPPNYLAKVLQQLANNGLVKGRRGVGGGYRLARTPDQINLIEIVRAVTEFQPIESCPLATASTKRLCPLHSAIDAATRHVINSFAAVSLQTLLDDPAPGGPLCGSN